MVIVSWLFAKAVEIPVPLAYVVVAVQVGTPLFQERTWPPTPLPKSVEVAMKVGTAEPGAALARTPFDAVPKEVTFDPEEVTAPLMLAFVVTVAALPPILSVDVETAYETPALAPMRPEKEAMTGALVKV